jgi:hypothetical protein
MWISLHECRSKRLGFTCFYATLLNVIKNDNMIGVFEQIFMEKQEFDLNVQCFYIYDKCKYMFCRRGLCEYLYINVHMLWQFCEQLSRVVITLFIVANDYSL